jgi:hypothetical protein
MSLPVGAGLSAKAKGKRPVGRGSEELLKANLSLPHLPATQSAPRNVFARAATYDQPQRTEFDTGRKSKGTEDGWGGRTRIDAPDAAKHSDEESMVLVMGSTGSGKSRFINKLAGGDKVREGHSLRSGLLNFPGCW